MPCNYPLEAWIEGSFGWSDLQVRLEAILVHLQLYLLHCSSLLEFVFSLLHAFHVLRSGCKPVERNFILGSGARGMTCCSYCVLLDPETLLWTLMVLIDLYDILRGHSTLRSHEPEMIEEGLRGTSILVLESFSSDVRFFFISVVVYEAFSFVLTLLESRWES